MNKAKLYDIVMAILALVSIFLIILDFGGVISLNTGYPELLNNVLLVVFTIDYFGRLALAKDKKKFFKDNIFDLLSIIPVSPAFNIFRLGRLARFFQIFRLLRLIGLTGKLNRLLHTNGLIYIIYTSICILVIAASMYSVSEHVPYGRSLWWAIATATTIGYGDISPHTFIGKLAAIFLMIVGIGIVGMLTSSLTNLFIHDHADDRMQKILDKLDQVEKTNRELAAEIRELKANQKKDEVMLQQRHFIFSF